MIPIYITSFYRYSFTLDTIAKIQQRTRSGTYQLHIYDNGSDGWTQDHLLGMLRTSSITSLTLDSRNTGCLYNKLVFHAMTESSCKYYIVSDNDVLPPKLSPCWLEQMTAIMDRHPEIALLTPQMQPTWLMQPYEVRSDVTYCEAVGNVFKMVRRDAFPFDQIKQVLGAYGDDGLVSSVLKNNGYKSAYCTKIHCFHADQVPDRGYTKEQLALDPRKINLSDTPYMYDKDPDTYEPR